MTGSIEKAMEEIKRTGGLTECPFYYDSKLALFCRIARVNWETGKSEYKPMDELPETLQLGNGGSWLRRDGVAGLFIWDVKHLNDKPNNKIIGLQTLGYNPHFNPKKIFKKPSTGCCVFTGVDSGLMEDHLEGNWIVFDRDDSRLDKTQTIHKSINYVKRSMCKKCKGTKIRPPAPDGYQVKFTHGDKHYKGSCKGCYIHNVVEFRNDYDKMITEALREKIKNLEKKNETQKAYIDSVMNQ